MAKVDRADVARESALVRMPAELRDRLQALAERNRRTIGAQLEVLLEEPLARAEAQGTGAAPPG